MTDRDLCAMVDARLLQAALLNIQLELIVEDLQRRLNPTGNDAIEDAIVDRVYNETGSAEELLARIAEIPRDAHAVTHLGGRA
jgi:hypothetical protein